MPRLPITHVVAIYQFERYQDTEEYSSSPVYQDINACISPTGTDIQATEGGVPSYQLFEFFIYDITVQLHNGDKIVGQDGIEYIVDGMPYVINNSYLQHIRVLGRQVV